MVKLLRILFLLIIAGAASAQAPESPTVRVGLLGIADNIPVLIADKHGYFKDEGLAVNVTTFAGGAAAMPALIAGIDLSNVTFETQIPVAVGVGVLMTGYAPTFAALIVAWLLPGESGIGPLLRPVRTSKGAPPSARSGSFSRGGTRGARRLRSRPRPPVRR